MKRRGEKMEEKRSAERVELNIDLVNSTDNVLSLKNVSEQGVCVITSEKYSVGRYFTRSFILPNGSGINIFGKVMWQKGKNHKLYETGVKFVSLGSTDREHLNQYIKKALKKKNKK